MYLIFQFVITYEALHYTEKVKTIKSVKRSRVGDPTSEGDETTPEGSLTLVSNLLLVVVNIGLDMLGNLTKLNITKY